MCIARYCYRKSSVRPSVCVVEYRGNISWVRSKVTTRIISLRYSLLAPQLGQSSTMGTPQKIRWGRCSQQKTCNISETGEDMAKVTIDD